MMLIASLNSFSRARFSCFRRHDEDAAASHLLYADTVDDEAA